MTLTDITAPSHLGERFWWYVDRSSGPQACWPWTATRHARGYGAYTIAYQGKAKPVKAHRLAWILTYGSIPDDALCLHHCDRRECVNPAHLFLGTASDNMRDMVAKGRQGWTKREPQPSRQQPRQAPRSDRPKASHKLSAAQKAEVRARWAQGETLASIGAAFGVRRQSIHEYLQREARKAVLRRQPPTAG
jgi:hypothetical protein